MADCVLSWQYKTREHREGAMQPRKDLRSFQPKRVRPCAMARAEHVASREGGERAREDTHQ